MQGCNDKREALRPVGGSLLGGVVERLDNLLVFGNNETCSAKERSGRDALPRGRVCCSSLVDVLVVQARSVKRGCVD